MSIATWLPVLAAVLAYAVPGYSHEPPPPPPPPPFNHSLVVATTSGRVHGTVDATLPNVHQFLGIPFAAPPVGARRWAAPQPLDQPDVDIDATQLPVSCMQFLTSRGNSIWVRDVLEFNLQGLNTTGAVSEDCLTLSVWAPANASSPSSPPGGYGGRPGRLLPVLIFIYGGGYGTGGEDVPYQIPAQWVNRAPDHLVVSFNYRLNIFGFPNAPGLSDQNLGILDQRAAVEWCRANIAAFGGDPARMVLWGQSAGAASVDVLNFAYPADPIVTGLIMDSDNAFAVGPTADTAQTNFTFVADHVGCAGLADGDDPAPLLACMRNVSADRIENFFASYQNSGAQPSLGFRPIADDKIIFTNYTQRALDGQQSQVPAIIGHNAQDGVAFVAYSPNGPTNQTQVLSVLLSTFFCPETEGIRRRQQTGRLTFRYVYAGNFSNISPRPWMGAYHSSELPLLMGTHANFRGPSTPLEIATSHAFQDAYVAFARDPVNGLATHSWQPYSQLGAAQVREFGAGVAAQDTSLKGLEDLCVGTEPVSPLP